jgi:hypothetical protein
MPIIEATPTTTIQAICQRGGHLPEASRTPDVSGPAQLIVPHQAVADDDGQEAQAVDEEGGADAGDADEQPRDRGTHDAGRIEGSRVQGHRVGQVFTAHHLDDERLAGGHIHGVAEPEQQGQPEDLPDLYAAAGGEDEQGQRQDHLDDLGDDERGSLGQ